MYHHRIGRMVFFCIAVFTHIRAQDISITDFRIPESQYGSLIMDLSGNYWGTTKPIGIGSNDFSRTLRSSASVRYERASMDEDRMLHWSVISDAGGESSSNGGSWNTEYSIRRSEQAGLASQFSYDGYIVPDLLFLYGSASFDGDYQWSSSSVDTHGVFQLRWTYRMRTMDLTVSAGLGIGRMREGSPVFYIIRIIERLKELSVFKRDLTHEEILELVDLFARKMEYRSDHERFTKYFFGELMDILRAKDVLTGPALSPYEVLYALEGSSESVYPRWFGWKATVGAGASSFQGEESIQNAGRYFNRSDIRFITASLSGGLPLTNNLHCYAALTAQTPVASPLTRTGMIASGQLMYELTERIHTDVSVLIRDDLNVRYFSDDMTQISYSERSYASTQSIQWAFRYFIEDDISLSTVLSWRDEELTYFSSTSSWKRSNTTNAIDFGISYRFY